MAERVELTRKVEIDWSADIPKEVRKALEPILLRRLDLLPGWVRLVAVFWNLEGEEDAALKTTTNYAYRRCELIVHGDWLSWDDGTRDFMIVHEFCHTIAGPTLEFVDRLMKMLEDSNEEVFKALEPELEAAVEATTEDMAAVLWRIIHKRDDD